MLVMTLASTAQESTLLRLNYNKGDKYIMTMDMTQDMSVMVMKMKMDMSIEILEVVDDIYKTEMQIKKISMDMNGMSYDSDKGDEELDVMGKQMKAQFDPMLEMLITSKTNNLGEVLEMKIEPDIAGANQFTNQSGSVIYPEHAVKVGDTWDFEKDSEGMKMSFIYTVRSIEKDRVFLDVSGEISSLAEGTINGNIEIDREKGIPLKSSIVMDMTVSGQNIKSSIILIMKKL